jgi:GT2 family glycosyltransferase
MKISYAIPVCNELKEIQRLLNFLLENKKTKDEIVILFDSINGTSNVEEYLRAKSINGEFNWVPYNFDGHFANMKNKLTSLCSGDYIFQIDADEIPNKFLIDNLPEVLESNPEADMLRVPRINTVEGLTEEHIKRWGWNVNEKGWVNWADWQMRIYRRHPNIKWVNKVHEIIKGYKIHGMLPAEEEWSLYHPKNIKRQEKQNNYYNTL